MHFFRNAQILIPWCCSIFIDVTLDDGQLSFDFRRLDVDRAALYKAATIAFVDVDVFGRAIGAEDDLLPLINQFIEDLEDDIERLFLTLQELDVVDQQNIGSFIIGLEVLIAGFLAIMLGHRIGVTADQFLTVHINGAQMRLCFSDVILNSTHQMRLTQATLTVDEQRIQRRTARHLSHLDRHTVSHSIRFTDDEVLEGDVRKRLVMSGIRLLMKRCCR